MISTSLPLGLGLGFLCFTTLVQGYTKFETKCLVPVNSTSFVSSPDSRGTLDILWSCFFVIIACTWTIQHLNVPEQREGRDPGLLGDLKWRLKGTWQTTKWMLVTVIAPEFIVGKAWGDLDEAKYKLEELQKFAEEDGVPWTITHSLLANMGGFVIKTYVQRLVNQGHDSATQTNRPAEAGEIQRLGDDEFEERPNKILNKQLIEAATTPKKPHDESLFFVNAPDILLLRRSRVLAKLPYITVDEINDKSKSDAMVRVLAIVQVGWTIIQAIARTVQHLAVSQLEIAVIAFAVCAIITYVLNWSKPKGVQVPHTLHQYNGKFPDHVRAVVEQDEFGWKNYSLISKVLSLLGYEIDQRPGESPSNASNVVKDGNFKNVAGTYLASVAFGSLHLLAWNLAFPTRIEKILWRVASVWCATSFLASFLIALVVVVNSNLFSGMSEKPTYFFIVFLPLVVYVFARLFLMVEIFRSLLFLPPSAYVGTWASNIPHIG